MKRKIVALLAAVMVLSGSSMTTLAASPSAPEVTIKDIDVSTKVEGTKADVVLKNDANFTTGLAAAVEAKVGNKAATVLATFDLDIPNATQAEKDAGIKVTFTVPGYQGTKKVKVFQFKNNAWNEVTVNSVASEKVTATFKGFCPIAIVEVDEDSDKTGVGFSALSLVAAAGLAGAVVCGKKKSN